jgi:XisI protein
VEADRVRLKFLLEVTLVDYGIDWGAIADDLMERGIPAQDIVLRFHSPSKRKFSEFAVG